MKRHEFAVPGGTVTVCCSDRFDGSFALDEPAGVLQTRRERLIGPGRRWVALRQVHGVEVFDPTTPRRPSTAGLARAGQSNAGQSTAGRSNAGQSTAGRSNAGPDSMPEADACVAFDSTVALSILTADCAPVVLVGSTGIAAIHAGWRGAVGGVIEAAAERLRAQGSKPVATLLGPCIQPSAYEFGRADLEFIVASFGQEIVGRTSDGADALDLTRVVQIACERAGWGLPERPSCTSNSSYFSHRARADTGRQATVAWIDWETE